MSQAVAKARRLDTSRIISAIDDYHLRSLDADTIDERDYWRRHRDQMQIALIEYGRDVRGEGAEI